MPPGRLALLHRPDGQIAERDGPGGLGPIEHEPDQRFQGDRNRQQHEVPCQGVFADVAGHVAGDAIVFVPDDLGVAGKEADMKARKGPCSAAILHELARGEAVERCR